MNSRGDSVLVTMVKGGAQYGLLEKRLPGSSWPHCPVSNTLARKSLRELTPVLLAPGGLRGQSTLDLESGIGILEATAAQKKS